MSKEVKMKGCLQYQQDYFYCDVDFGDKSGFKATIRALNTEDEDIIRRNSNTKINNVPVIVDGEIQKDENGNALYIPEMEQDFGKAVTWRIIRSLTNIEKDCNYESGSGCGWNLTDDKGKVLPINENTITNLMPFFIKKLKSAIGNFQIEQDKMLVEIEKNL